MFRRLWALIRGTFGLLLSRAERRSPEALLEVEQENLRAQVERFNQGLAAHAARCERLAGQARRLEAEGQDLREKTAAHLRAGNQEVAGQYALRFQAAGRELADTHEQLRQAEETYAALVKARDEAVRAAQAKIDALRQSVDELKAKKALAALNAMAAGMTSSVGAAGATLDRLRAQVEDEADRAAGRARVAGGQIGHPDAGLRDDERKALADLALADFAAREAAALPAPPRQIGPPPAPPPGP